MRDKAVFSISVPNPFQLRLMLLSHGWVDLLPFQWDEEAYCLHAVIRTHGDRAFALTIKSRKDNQPGQKLEVFKTAGPRLAEKDRKILKERIRWSFRLDDDFRPFQERCAETPGLEWIHEFGLGPFLRNTHPFEEFTKVLLTTNINWGGTKSINNHLLTHLGDPVSPGLKKGSPASRKGRAEPDDEPRGIAYPLPEKVAKKSERFLREKIRLGYRAPYLKEQAHDFLEGRIDFDALLDPDLSMSDLTKTLKAIKGFGPYAVNTVLMTIGRYDDLILDSWIRKMVGLRYFKGKKVSDKAIRKIYAPWGRWAGLACWFECAYDTWLEEDLKKRGRG